MIIVMIQKTQILREITIKRSLRLFDNWSMALLSFSHIQQSTIYVVIVIRSGQSNTYLYLHSPKVKRATPRTISVTLPQASTYADNLQD